MSLFEDGLLIVFESEIEYLPVEVNSMWDNILAFLMTTSVLTTVNVAMFGKYFFPSCLMACFERAR